MSKYQELYKSSLQQPNEFWKNEAQRVAWHKQPSRILDESNKPFYRWFSDGQLNVCYNCVDRHVEAGRGDQVAIYYDSPVTNSRASFTYKELLQQVQKVAKMLIKHGVQKGDRVIIYMPMIPQAVFAMLACARIGAIHSVVFGGFSAKVLASRIDDCQPKLILTASCGIEATRIIAYKPLLEEAQSLAAHQVSSCIIWQRSQSECQLQAQNDFCWQDEVADCQASCECVNLKATDLLYILYTSGTTGNPKGILRDSGGYVVALLASMEYLYNVKPGDVFWSASDIGWVVGHSYIVYAPLAYGCSTLLFEGKPIGTPDAGAFWRIIEEYRVKVLFTAPTAIRAIIKEDSAGSYIEKYDTSSLQGLFLAGERTDPTSIQWARNKLKVAVVDHWWQTETGWAICGNPLGVEELPIKDGSCTLPMPGWEVQCLDDETHSAKPADSLGSIAIKLPLPPSSLPGLWGLEHKDKINLEAFFANYLAEFPGFYKTGDAGKIDEDGYVTILSRTDDIINVAGHRLSTGAIEESISADPEVAECAVIGLNDQIKGQVPAAFVVVKKGVDTEKQELEAKIIQKVREDIGPVAALKKVLVVSSLPKTRSGKILRATIRKISHGEDFVTPPTIEDIDSLRVIKEAFENS